MAEFSKLITTQKGQALIAKVLAGTATEIDFTSISTSSTQYDVTDLEGLTELTNIQQTSLISSKKITNSVAVELQTAFTNTDLTVGYYMRTLGLYAEDPDDGEILFAVTIETSGNCYMPPYNGVTVSGAMITLVTTVGNADEVSLEVDPAAVATLGDINELQDQINTLNQNVSAHNSQINTLNQKATITKATLAAGATSITISDSRITTDSILSFYTSKYGVNPTAVSVTAGSVTLTFKAQSATMEVGVRVDG